MPRKQRFRPNRRPDPPSDQPQDATTEPPTAQRPASEIVSDIDQEATTRARIVTSIVGVARGCDLVEQMKATIADERDPAVVMAALTEFVRFTLQVCDVTPDLFASQLTSR